MSYPSVEKLVAFESGELEFPEVVELFQDLIDSGVAWQLQGFYGRTAQQLIDDGYCKPVIH